MALMLVLCGVSVSVVRQGGRDVSLGRGLRGISMLEGELAMLRSGMTDVDVLVCQ